MQPTPQPQPQPGQLTAGEWDDNRYFEFYLEVLETLRGQTQMPAVAVADRIVLTVTGADGVPLPGAEVEILSGQVPVLRAPTATDGRLLFFPEHDGAEPDSAYVVRITLPDGSTSEFAVPDESGADARVNSTAWKFQIEDVVPTPVTALDLAFVIDATGSMDDELEYIKVEVENIVADLRAAHPDVSMRFALVVYRDDGDDYVTRHFDFVSDLAEFQDGLAQQKADGGGDYPEAMDAAIRDMNELQWRRGAVARVAFLIADAPPHEDKMQRFLDAADNSRRAGIKMYPIAASGVAQEAEYLMRIAAQRSLARYLFLTDDSGIGNPHAEPHVPCYQVEYLNQLLTRTVRSELEGAYRAPDPDRVLRTVGEYEGDQCVLPSQPEQP